MVQFLYSQPCLFTRNGPSLSQKLFILKPFLRQDSWKKTLFIDTQDTLILGLIPRATVDSVLIRGTGEIVRHKVTMSRSSLMLHQTSNLLYLSTYQVADN